MIEFLEKLKELTSQIPSLQVVSTNYSAFDTWYRTTSRTIKNLFGKDSQELIDFEQIRFGSSYRNPFGMTPELEGHFKGLDEAEKLLKEYIMEAEIKAGVPQPLKESKPQVKNLFISHSSKDRGIAKEITYLLEALGVPSDLIFNSSIAGYGVKPGEDWVETLKAKISTEGVVISLISENYYKSPVSLCEMGATWVLSKSHFPIVLPPLTFEEIKGVIPTKHSIMINDSERWSELKEELEKIFELTPIPVPKWDGKKKDILDRIDKLLHTK